MTERIYKIIEINEPYGVLIGNFDGVHIGHQELIRQFKEKCAKKKLKSVIISFWPHPEVYFNQAFSEIIYSREMKVKKISNLEVDYFFELPFDEIRNLSPRSFIDFIKTDMMKMILVGYDFHFGKDRAGDFAFLKNNYGDEISVDSYGPFEQNDKIPSSTYIRQLIEEGNFKQVCNFLGEMWALTGVVQSGKQLGAQIGIPTANLVFSSHFKMPPKGVYVTHVSYQGKIYNSVTNIGVRPTVEDTLDVTVETHLLDFKGDLYGDEIEVVFHRKIRNELKFNSVSELVIQIKKDIDVTRDFFESL